MENKENNTENKSSDTFLKKGELIAFAYDVGFAIIVPLVLLTLVGVWLDKKYATTPLFIIIGLLCSLITTSISIYKKTKKFL